MQWSPTDQFGNLNVATSEAASPAELRPDLASLIEELHARAGGPFVVTIDMDYTEINGPDPERVSHILQVPNLASFHTDQSPEEIRGEIASAVAEICAEQGIAAAEVQLA
jgi:hypothetical protein